MVYKYPGYAWHREFQRVNDERIRWLLEQLGNVEGEKILELGPLEGGHTYMLEHAGAKVTSVEGNYGAFLRCLTVKNLLGLECSKFYAKELSTILKKKGPYF